MRGLRISFTTGTRPNAGSLLAIAVISFVVGVAQAEPAARNYDPSIISLLDRLTFGATIEDAEHLQAAGVKRWLDAQLHPSTSQDMLPAVAQAQIDALGRFRDLLAATLRHPAMLRYLDNAQNAAGHVNENYAREIMELHTMGVGSGYTQHEVEELARILTGVGIDSAPENPHSSPEFANQFIRDGLFEFNPARHDYGGAGQANQSCHPLIQYSRAARRPPARFCLAGGPSPSCRQARRGRLTS
jgi:Protein of unknown function (DUF1800)